MTEVADARMGSVQKYAPKERVCIQGNRLVQLPKGHRNRAPRWHELARGLSEAQTACYSETLHRCPFFSCESLVSCVKQLEKILHFEVRGTYLAALLLQTFAIIGLFISENRTLARPGNHLNAGHLSSTKANVVVQWRPRSATDVSKDRRGRAHESLKATTAIQHFITMFE